MRLFNKLKTYAIVFRRLLQKQVAIESIKQNPKIMIRSLREKGVQIDDDVFLFSPETLKIDVTRPSLVTIHGGGTFLHTNFTILTHDYATLNFLNKYKEFVPNSGRVVIGNNVWFGQNVTVLRGSYIGDNCIIGYGSVVMGKIPANSVAAGCPCKVICTLDEYFEKRKKLCVEEAFDYACSIQERFGRRPVLSDFFEEFPLFVSGNEVDKYPEIPIRRQMKEAYDHYVKTHKAQFSSFDEFFKAAGL